MLTSLHSLIKHKAVSHPTVGRRRTITAARRERPAARYGAKTKGKVERPYRYVCEDVFLARSFRNFDDLNAQLRHWLDTVANPRVHATSGRVVAEAQPQLQPLPLVPFRSPGER
jgi:hypothetical protein